MAFAYLVFTVSTCANLWLLARLTGVPIRFRQVLRMRFQNVNTERVIGALVEAKTAGLTVSSAEIEQAYLQRVDLERVIVAMIKAPDWV
jgi:uncharacterized protein YqfA (UPF0365 family)